MSGYERLMEAVKRDCNDIGHCACFNPDGCDKERHQIGRYGEPGFKACTHRYCDKFKWAVERAKHYAEKSGVPWEKILDSWENARNYWYMNYYQAANQPEIKDGAVRVFDTVEDFRESVKEPRFRCPHCGGISTNPYACDAGGCDWKIYGLIPFGGVHVFCKDVGRVEHIFMPIAWEEQEARNA